MRTLDRFELEGHELGRAYFYDKIAPRILDKTISGAELLTVLEQSASCVDKGRDIEPFIHENSSVLANITYLLPNINDDISVKQEAFQQIESIIAINKLVNTHIYREDNYVENHGGGNFHNGGDESYYQMPLQGWKMHISANNLEDYRKLLETALPEFNRYGVIYKVLDPYSFESFSSGAQAGKHITVYLNEAFDMSKFSPELRDMLQEQGPIVEGELSLGGRMFARYGRFREEPIDKLVCPYGSFSYDERGLYSPSWASVSEPNQIMSIATMYAERLNSTNDYKAYAQEMFTMNHMAPNNYLYCALEINAQDIELVEELLSDYKNNNFGSFGSAIYELEGHTYVMLHENDIDFAYVLEHQDVKYIRPDWDYKCNMYFINPEHASLAREMIGHDTTDISLAYFKDNSVAVCVDSLIKEGSWTFLQSIDFEGFGIQVTGVAYSQDHPFAIEQIRIQTQGIDLTIPSHSEQEGIEWD